MHVRVARRLAERLPVVLGAGRMAEIADAAVESGRAQGQFQPVGGTGARGKLGGIARISDDGHPAAAGDRLMSQHQCGVEHVVKGGRVDDAGLAEQRGGGGVPEVTAMIGLRAS